MSGWAQIKSVSTARMSNESSKQILNKSHSHLTLKLIISNENGLLRSKYHIWDAQHDTSNLAASNPGASKSHLDSAWLDFIAILVTWTLFLILVFEELRCASSWEPFAALPWGEWIFIYLKKILLTSLARSFASPWRDSWRFWFSSNRSCDVCNCLKGTGSALERYFCEGALSENVGRH